jgi:hypothetical protein
MTLENEHERFQRGVPVTDARIAVSIGGMWREAWDRSAAPVGAFRKYIEAAKQAVAEVSKAVVATKNAPTPHALYGGKTVHDFAKERIVRLDDKEFHRMGAAFAAAREELESKMAGPSLNPAVATEIRGVIRAMSPTDRSTTLRTKAGDPVTSAAVLGAPAYLSGLTDEQQAEFRELARRTQHPDEYAALLAVQGAYKEASRSGGLAIKMISGMAGLRKAADGRWLADHEADDSNLTAIISKRPAA